MALVLLFKKKISPKTYGSHCVDGLKQVMKIPSSVFYNLPYLDTWWQSL